MDALKKIVYISPPAQVVELDDIDSIEFSALTAANQAVTEHDADAIEIELTAEQMDALLAGRWVP